MVTLFVVSSFIPPLCCFWSLCAELQVNSVFCSSRIDTPTRFLLFVCSKPPQKPPAAPRCCLGLQREVNCLPSPRGGWGWECREQQRPEIISPFCPPLQRVSAVPPSSLQSYLRSPQCSLEADGGFFFNAAPPPPPPLLGNKTSIILIAFRSPDAVKTQTCVGAPL